MSNIPGREDPGWRLLEMAAADVVRERVRQVKEERFSPSGDDRYRGGQLAQAAAAYALGSTLFGKLPAWMKPSQVIPRCWPWSRDGWRPTDRRMSLVKAGALILAEIERIDREESRKGAENA